MQSISPIIKIFIANMMKAILLLYVNVDAFCREEFFSVYKKAPQTRDEVLKGHPIIERS